MTQIELPAFVVGAKSEPKEMFSVVPGPDGKLDIRINFSSLDLIQTCKRKAYLSLERGLRANEESAPLSFGSAIHKALEVWYCAPRASRKESSAECDDSQALMLAGAAPLSHGNCVRCASVFSFIERGNALRNLPDGDKRSLSNGTAILNAYFDHYAHDPFRIAEDEDGPICERKFEFLLTEDDRRRITFFGTIDAVLVNEETNTLLVTDHKTTSQLGSDFYNRVRPNFQYVGYVLAAHRALRLNTSAFMSNGVQVAKTKKEFARQVTRVTEEDFTELTHAVEYAVDDYLRCKERGVWPMSSPNPCCMYGRCAYAAICEVPEALKENVISAMYGETK
ncbi:MAG TPA: PD-(D/E)XK nuclease family protein [Pyrinomonadaceae bacterium]|nr:PD-(D/E)XK nuclease family protein [Pyrinomonadaceae bacterium]